MNRIERITDFLIDNAPAIFTGLSIIGVIETTYLAVKATPKAIDELDKAYLEKGESLNKREVIATTWREYLPAACMAGATIFCIIGANKTHIQKETALAATTAFFENRYSDYRQKLIETREDGEELDREIENSIAKDKMLKDPPPKYLREYADMDGSILCYEPYTEQYFLATKSQLMWAELTANKMFAYQQGVTLNQILKLFPGVVADKPLGDKIGWYLTEEYYEFVTYNTGFWGAPYLDLQPKIEAIDGQEVMIISYSIEPIGDPLELDMKLPYDHPQE